MNPSIVAHDAALRSIRSNVQLARDLGVSEATIRRWRGTLGVSTPKPPPPVKAPLGPEGRLDAHDGSVTLTSPPLPDGLSTRDAESYLRSRWGFGPEWVVLSCTGNEWQSGDGEGGVRTYTQVKGSFRKSTDIAAVLPRPAVWKGPTVTGQYGDRTCSSGGTWQCVVVADHQAPYHDEALVAATRNMVAELQPAEIAHIGDLCDYTNISAHKDHAVVAAAVNECTDSGVQILTNLRTAAPHARIRIAPGNHDVRPFKYLLAEAGRMAGVRTGNLPSSPGSLLLDFRTLWRLDELGIEIVDDPRGWEHAEIEIIPGPKGLVAVHGYRTGSNVAERMLEDVGRSVLVGHIHRPEHVFRWSKQLNCEQQAMVVGCSCEVRGGGAKSFPAFAPNDRWLQGAAVVTVHPDGEFSLERARWNGKRLYCGGRSWSA